MKLDYLELPAKDLTATKQFFEDVFNWKFTDYGEEYVAFNRQGLEGGFYKSELQSRAGNGAALPIFKSDNLQELKTKIEQAGGEIIQDFFDFPGGKRFHFTEPSGNEFAVWSQK